MSNIRKAGMLIVLLAFPAFFFLFLRGCGTNHYDLPYFYPLSDSAGRVVFDGADTVYYRVSGVLGVTPGEDTVTSGVLDGRINAFYPGGDNLAEEDHAGEEKSRLLERLEKEGSFQFLERAGRGGQEDRSAPTIIRLAAVEGADPWEGILKIDEKNASGGTLYENSLLVLVDGERHIRGYYDLSDPEDFDRALAEIKILLYQKSLAEK